MSVRQQGKGLHQKNKGDLDVDAAKASFFGIKIS